MRLAEVVLNWIEAKAELAANHGGAAVTQSDLDLSVNAIRDRPLDAGAEAKGVEKTAHLMLAALPNDPDRDADVSPLIWEIRRERRMEFFFENTRLLDIKRWKKIDKMDYSLDPDHFFGPWVDFPAELPGFLNESFEGILTVRKADDTEVTYDGTNGSEMVGYFKVENASNRNAFGDEVYLYTVGEAQINLYAEKGYTLTQSPGW